MANIVVETIEDEVRVALQVDDGSPPTISQQVFPQNYFSESPRFLFASSSPYSVPLLVTNSSSGTNTEERHILFSGSKGCGKTSLIFRLGRGIFPTQDILPERFEGWCLSTTTTGETSKKLKPYLVNMTFWEDKERKNLPSNQVHYFPENKKSLNAEESENNKIKSCLKEDVEPSVHPEHDFLRTNYHPKFTKSLKDSSNYVYGEKKGSSTNKPFIPKYPIYCPEPDLVVACFAIDKPETYKILEQAIGGELKERFTNIPILLVSTKADLYADQQSVESFQVEASELDDELKKESGEQDGNDKLGNSNDIIGYLPDHLITSEDGISLAKKIGAFAFVETSAKDGRGLQQVIDMAISVFIVRSKSSTATHIMEGQLTTTLSLSGYVPRKTSFTDGLSTITSLLSTSFPKTLQGSSPTSREDRSKGRKISSIIEGSSPSTNSCQEQTQDSSSGPSLRQRKISFGLTKKMFKNSPKE